MTLTIKYLLFSLALGLSWSLDLTRFNPLSQNTGQFQPLAKAQQAPVLAHYNYQIPLGSLKVKADLYAASPEQALQFKQVLSQRLKLANQSWHLLLKHSSQAQTKSTSLSENEFKLFQNLQNSCQWSQGAFDISDYPLRKIWGFTPDSLAARLPTTPEIDTALQQIACQNIVLDSLPARLFLANPDTRLNLEAVRRGWIIDALLPALKQLSITAFAIKIDELAYYHGSPPGAQAWKIPWSHPRAPEQTFTDLYAKDQALSLVGDYQDFFMHNGIRYSSLLDSRSGYPTTENLAVQVTAPTALEAEIIAKTIALLDDQETKAYLKQVQHGPIYKIVDQNGIMYPVKY